MLRIKLINKYCVSCRITDISQNVTRSMQYQTASFVLCSELKSELPAGHQLFQFQSNFTSPEVMNTYGELINLQFYSFFISVLDGLSSEHQSQAALSQAKHPSYSLHVRHHGGPLSPSESFRG